MKQVNDDQLDRVACVGLGTIGRAWAVLFAASGHPVAVYDPSRAQLGRSMTAIEKSLRDLETAGLVISAARARERLQVVDDLQEAVNEACYVQESAPEDLSLKQALYTELDASAPEGTILASSTSEMPGSRLFSNLSGRYRCIVAHPLNPPHVIPLVEICPTPWTSVETVRRAMTLMRSVGQKPILVRKEISGFIANRLQLAVLAEALHLVAEGYCNAEDIDIAMKDGLARRWAIVGPFETGHLNAEGGYAAYIEAYGETHRKIISDLKIDYPWGDDVVMRIDAELSRVTPHEKAIERQAWRDRKLMTLARLLGDDQQRTD